MISLRYSYYTLITRYQIMAKAESKSDLRLLNTLLTLSGNILDDNDNVMGMLRAHGGMNCISYTVTRVVANLTGNTPHLVIVLSCQYNDQELKKLIALNVDTAGNISVEENTK